MPVMWCVGAKFTSDELAAMQGAMDASNLLKPMLGRGELRCIGATTLVRPLQALYFCQPFV